jgi:hypothetical protein
VLFLLLGQRGDLGVDGMIGLEQCLLAMEDRRIRTDGVIEAVDLASAVWSRNRDKRGYDRISTVI